MHDLLKASGLKESEIKIYMHLLAHGLSLPPAIARATKIARPNVYATLQSLKEKELVAEQKKGKRRAYYANDPVALVHTLDLRKQAVEQALPDLRAMYVAEKNKPSIRFFEGPEQVKQIFMEILEAKNKEVFGVASTKKLFAAIGNDFFAQWDRQIKERDIFLNDILTADSMVTAAPKAKEIMKAHYTTKALPESVGDLPSDILIWDDNVALISIEKPVYGTVIRNQAIADTMRIMFRQTWNSL
jgi:sugar-specific transcriptional regulator TrmB